jgi:Recombination endonuclease VII
VKRCTRCKKTKALAEFAKNKQQKDGRHIYCRDCRTQYARDRRVRNPKVFDAKSKAAYGRWAKSDKATAYWAKKNAKTYGIPDPTHPEPDRCEICGDLSGARSLHRDHCHTKKIFRGWLCARCNMAVGFLRDDPLRADKLAAYLRRF